MMRSSKKKKGLQSSMKKPRFSSNDDDDDDDDDGGSASKGFLKMSILRSKSSGYSSNDDGYGASSKKGKGGRRHRSVSPQRSSDAPSNNKASVSFDDDAVKAPTPTAGGASPYANAYERPAYANTYSRDSNAPKKEKSGEKSKKSRTVTDTRKHRVRPYRCFSEPTYMTEDDIYKDMMKPSSSAVFLKSHFPPNTSKIPGEVKISDAIRNLYDSPEVDGRIGSVRVEVLGCVGLGRQKPYVAIYVVSGDSAFCTDVLNNFRSPMWPSNSTRAAVFPVHHAYARVFVGVFDVRARQGKENDVFCGRVALDIACIRPNTEYDVTFPLRASSFVYDRRKRGVIRLRFSLHWFSERAAICSYLKSSRWFSASEPAKGLGQPTIPCAEPKTFRNVAVTCHGQDFPGKYTRLAFRATMREFNLYHLNLRFMMKTLVLDALLYERPHISLYLFLAFQHCIFSNIVRMVPPYASGYIILLFLDNYASFNVSERFNLGYKPLSVFELFMGLVKDGNGEKPQMKPQLIKKRAKKVTDKKSKKKGGDQAAAATTTESFFSAITGGGGDADDDDDGGVELVPRDHREFPFSERDEYPKFSVQEALAPSTKPPTKGEEGNTRMQGRLSIYFVKEESKQDVKEEEEEEKEGGEDEDSGQEGSEEEDEDESIASTADSQVGDSDVFDMDLEPDEDDIKQSGGLFDTGTSRIKRARVRVGPPQNCDISPRKKTPPQQTLQKIEKQLHKLSRGVALERVITVPGARKYGPDPTEDATGKKKGKSQADLMAKSTHYDDFDKILGLQTKYTNPVLRITSSFLGPLMRMIRVFLYITRIAFNLTTWRDPFLSFWVLVILSSQTFLLLIWPWRPFLFISSFLCLGPQNIFVRKYLEKKAAEKAQAVREKKTEKEAPEATATNEKSAAATDYMNNTASSKKVEVNMDQFGAGKKKNRSSKLSGLLSKTFRSKSSDSGSQTDDESIGEDVGGDTQEQRPAFSTQHNSRSSKKLRPREVAVPYSKLRKDRFYDWPPDPTVSRATPVPIGPYADYSPEELAGGASPSKSSQQASQPSAQPVPQANGDDVLETLRRRYVAEQQQLKVGDGNGAEFAGMSPW